MSRTTFFKTYDKSYMDESSVFETINIILLTFMLAQFREMFRVPERQMLVTGDAAKLMASKSGSIRKVEIRVSPVVYNTFIFDEIQTEEQRSKEIHPNITLICDSRINVLDPNVSVMNNIFFENPQP